MWGANDYEGITVGKDDSPNLLSYVCDFKSTCLRACELASENLNESQDDMKIWCDENARAWEFQPGEKVSVLLLM